MDSGIAQAGICHTQKRFVMEIAKPNRQRGKMFQLRHQIRCVERDINPGEDRAKTDSFGSLDCHVRLRHTHGEKISRQGGSFPPTWPIQMPTFLMGKGGKAHGNGSSLPQ